MIQKKVSQPVKTVVSIKPGSYCMSILDNTISFPFCISPNLMAKMTKLKERSRTQNEIAKNVYDFVSKNVEYGYPYSKQYATSLEVWKNKKGVCGESAFLYTTLARFCGLKSQFVCVRTHPDNEHYTHACSVVYTPRQLFVDIANQTFNVRPREYKILTDKEVFERFTQWRNR